MMARYGMLINTKKCIGCYACRTACQRQNDLLPDESFIRFEEREVGKYPNVTVEHIPLQCMHCEDAPCAAVCPTAALELPASYTVGNPETGETGDIIIGTAEIDPRTCLAYRMTGCRDCYDACNYSAIELKDEGGANPIPYVVEDKCNGCGACQAACLSLSSGSIKSTERAIVVRPIEA